MWLWRGTQSAIFYYVSLSPCFEHRHKRKRKREASRSQKERDELSKTQPGIIHQPVPFQTNPFWAEEIVTGPGPPRGWRRHSLDNGEKSGSRFKKGKDRRKSVFSPSAADRPTPASGPSTSSSEVLKPQEVEGPPQSARPSLWASPSGTGITLDTFKETFRSTIPENWNWKRYDREDETLFGINDKISRMWDRATSHAAGPPSTGDRIPVLNGRKRAGTTESDDDYSWRYAQNPGVNDLHPPTVTRLPRTHREIEWIKQPPPSRAVMEGKVQPGMESTQRRPLCRIEGRPIEPEKTPNRVEARTGPDEIDFADKDRRPPPTAFYSAAEDADESDDDTYIDTEHFSPYDSSFAQTPRSGLLPSSPPSSPPHADTIPRAPSLLRRPPLAVLVDPNNLAARMKLHSTIPPKPPPPIRVDGSNGSRTPSLDNLEVLLGVVLPRMPERSRYSLPNVRIGEA